VGLAARSSDVEFQVVECGDAGDGMVNAGASASALAEDLVVFEAGDGVFGDRSAFAEPAVGSVFDDAAVRSSARAADAVDAAVPSVAGDPPVVG
jgi:hypothetical protein